MEGGVADRTRSMPGGRSWRRPRRGSARLAKSGATTEADIRYLSSRSREEGSSVDRSRTITSLRVNIRSISGDWVRAWRIPSVAPSGGSSPVMVGPPWPAVGPAGCAPSSTHIRRSGVVARTGGSDRHDVLGHIGGRRAFDHTLRPNWPLAWSHRKTVAWPQSVTSCAVSASSRTSSVGLPTRDRASENERRVRAVASLCLAWVSTLKMSSAEAANSACILSTRTSEVEGELSGSLDTTSRPYSRRGDAMSTMVRVPRRHRDVPATFRPPGSGPRPTRVPR